MNGWMAPGKTGWHWERPGKQEAKEQAEILWLSAVLAVWPMISGCDYFSVGVELCATVSSNVSCWVP